MTTHYLNRNLLLTELYIQIIEFLSKSIQRFTSAKICVHTKKCLEYFYYFMDATVLATYMTGVLIPLQMSPSLRGRRSGIPWQITSLTDVQHERGKS